MSMTCKYCIPLFLAILVLQNTGVHIGIFDSGNVAYYIKAPVYK